MTRQMWVGLALVTLLGGSWVSAGELPCGEPAPCLLKRVAPAGGWCPYGGPWCWWNPCCFPHCGGPDDYCRKELPHVCWPAYPPWYVWVPTGCCEPHGCCPCAGEKPH